MGRSLHRRITEPHDERITPAGAIIRKTKVDEFPNFWNVLRGDMSIVGPRPEDYDIVQNHYSPEQRRVLNVQPGICSPEIVEWYPEIIYHDPAPDGVSAQEWYVERHVPVLVAAGLRYGQELSFRRDLKVIAQTFACIVRYSFFSPKRRPFRPQVVSERQLGPV